MKTTAFLLLLTFLALPLANANAGAPAHGKDLVSTAVADGRFTVLATALEHAGLIETLQSSGPFTVFAPTDDAFAALPDGTVAGLLAPEQKAALRRVLLAHVVSGRVLASDLRPAAHVRTLADADFAVGLTIGNAKVTQADVLCANGVIHVIDAVLLPPPARSPEKKMDVSQTIHAAIEQGVPLYNGGDAQACADVYEQAATALVSSESLSDLVRVDLRRTLLTASKDPSAYAWALREGFDRALEDMAFEPRLEAELPEGFPMPGPVGQVMEKRYPRYRAARAEQGNQMGAFWKLFQHIKTNNIAMTAPVEMTMDGDMRMTDMAFLYGSTGQGRAGAQGGVDVIDVESTTVLSIGMRGENSEERIALAKALVEARRKALGLETAGEWRMLGYNSPMVSASKRFWELQIPVAKK